MPFDEKIKNRLGFGCMRLKMNGDAVDYDEFNKMIDLTILIPHTAILTARVRLLSVIALWQDTTERTLYLQTNFPSGL